MKTLINNISTRLMALTVILCLSFSCSNSDLLDINDDPNFSASATNIQLMPAAQAGYVIALSSMIERAAATMVQQYINGRFDSYGFDGSAYDNHWSNIYAGALQDLELIIDQGEVNGDAHFVGIAKIQKAYIFSILVDLFGDVPYSQAIKPGVFDAPAEPGAEIYPDLLRLIDEGLADLNEESAAALGGSDLIYAGDLDDWRRMANTLKLKMHLQTRLVDASAAATAISDLLASGNLIASSGQNFTWQFSSSNAPEGRHPNFQSDWAAGSLENNLASFMISRMNASADPRRPYYFYRQNSGANLVGVNGGETSSPGDDNVRAIFGIYPVGGAYDDASFQVHNETLGLKGAGIYPMITYTSRLFMEAEAALALGTAGDPRALLEAAINASFSEIQNMSGVAMDATEMTDYIDAVLADYDAAADADARLEILINEKYIAMFGNGIEAYNDYRRTGYPTGLLTPIVSNGPYPNRLPLPPVEFNNNANIDPLVDLSSKVFWDLN